jgi:hypothetical protein
MPVSVPISTPRSLRVPACAPLLHWRVLVMGKRALRYTRDCRCLECGRTYYPQRLSPQTREPQRLHHRLYSRRRAKALRLVKELGLTL